MSSTGSALSTPLPDQDSTIERALLYRGQDNRLENKSQQPSPFRIAIDKETGVGHLQTHSYPSRNHTKSMISIGWSERVSFPPKPEEPERKLLTLDDAKEFWGEPQKHSYESERRYGKPFYTFHAHSKLQKTMYNQSFDEDNIFHLDLRFDDTGVISAYRVRGIGISKPQWITADWKPELLTKAQSQINKRETGTDDNGVQTEKK